MKHFASILFLIYLFLSTVQGKIWTVDNTGRLAHYNVLSTAITAASPGDTLFLGGGGASYGDMTLAKKLCIIGPGYFLTENPGNNEYYGPASINTGYLNAGSDGSVLVGITAGTSITVNSNNNVVMRCRASRSITVTGDNNVIKQNFVLGTSGGPPMDVSGVNNTIRNNAFFAYGGATANALDCGASNIVENNIFNGTLIITSSTFGNNILEAGTNVTMTTCTSYNNIGNSTQFGTANGNLSNVTMSTVFVGTGSTDGKWQLATGSPAIGAGQAGIDCGMYGGADPYVLSGIPNIPFFSSVLVPGRTTPSNGLNVKVNIQSKK